MSNPADTQADLMARLREQYAEQFKEEQALEIIHNYERERFEAADEIERLRASNKQLREALLQIEIEATASEDAYALLKQIYALARAALKDGDKT